MSYIQEIRGTRAALRTAGSNDSDAAAFFEAAVITDATQKAAINTLVRDLKDNFLWDKMLAIYPMCGGTSLAHATNLKTPNKYAISWQGNFTHDAYGVQGYGGYGATEIVPAAFLQRDDVHLSFYAGTEYHSSQYGIFLGAADPNYSNGLYFYARQGGNTDQWSFRCNSSSEDGQTVDSTRSELGLNILTRTAYNVAKMFNRKYAIVDYSGRNPATGLASYQLTLFAIGRDSVANVSLHRCQFSSVGSGLSDADADTFTDIVQNYQAALQRVPAGI